MVAWGLIQHAELPAARNMAVDHVLFQRAEAGRLERPILRLYRWAQPTLSLGFHQSWQRACRLAALQAEGVTLVRRPTGGRAVLHADELTYSVVAPLRPPFSGRIADNYALIARALMTFSRHFGPAPAVAAAESRGSGPNHQAPCFASLAVAEIEANKKKLIGSSQKMGRQAFLQHGSIPLRNHSELLQKVTGTTLQMDHYMTCLEELCGSAGLSLPPWQELSTAFSSSFASIFGEQEAISFDLEGQEVEVASALYASDPFTFRR
jgi:lipoate-protein ligase A